MAESRFFYHDEDKPRPNAFQKAGRRMYADATWVAATGWQMLGDMPKGKGIQHGLQNVVWHMQDVVWGMQEQIEVVSHNLHQKSIRRQQNRAYEKLQLLAFMDVPIDKLAFVLQRPEYAALSPQIKDAFIRDIALKKLYQQVQGEERFFAESILAQSAKSRR